MSIIDSITITDNTNIDVITVAQQGPSGPNQILSKSVNNITLASSDNGGALIYDSGNGFWTVSTQGGSPTTKVRELTFTVGGAVVASILDEDNLGSNSATALATQQSIKAYVDTQLALQDQLNVSDGSSSIEILLGSETFGIVGGTGVTSAASGNNVTLSIGQSVGTGDNVTFNNVIVSGNLTVSGTQTVVNTATLSVADNKITLNSDYTGDSPTENGGIEVERGSIANVEFVWNETTDRWTADNPLQATEYYVGSTKVIDSSGVWQGPSTGLKGQKGEIGVTGPTGSKGQKGEAGEKGQKGEIGATGDKGQKGQQGDQGIQGDKGQKGEIGDKGQKGEQGIQGIQGDKGQKGEIGDKGQKGEVGAQGIQGDKGQKGTTGDKGQKGEIGNTAVSYTHLTLPTNREV